MATLNDLTDGYNAVSVALLDGAGAAASTTFKSLGSWRDDDIPKFIDTLSPQLIGFKQKAAQAAIAYSGQVAALEGKPFVQPSLAEIDLSTEALRNGTNVEDVYRRPFVQMRMALAKNPGDFTAALNTGALTARSLARTEVQLSRRKVSLFARKYNKNVVGYLRTLTGMESCALCYVASSQRYHKGDLLPIHPGCDCGEMPIYGDSDPGQIIDKQLLDKSHEAVGDRFGSIARTARGDGDTLPDYNKIMIEDHGEMGPMLSVKGQGFTGPNDLSLKGKSMPKPEIIKGDKAIQGIRKKFDNIDGAQIKQDALGDAMDFQNAYKYRAKTFYGPGPKTKANLEKVLDLGKDVSAEIDSRVGAIVSKLTDYEKVKPLQIKLDAAKGIKDKILSERNALIEQVAADNKAEYLLKWGKLPKKQADVFDRLAKYDARGRPEWPGLRAKYEDALDNYQKLLVEIDQFRPTTLAIKKIRAEETLKLLAEVRNIGQTGLANKLEIKAVGSTGKLSKEILDYALEGYPTDWVSVASAKFSGKLSTRFVDRGGFGRGEINLSGTLDSPAFGLSATDTAYHELGHMMEESIDGLKAMEWAYFNKRADGVYSKWGTAKEGGLIDKWADPFKEGKPYQGRVYSYGSSPTDASPTNSYEIFTTGIESVYGKGPYFEYADGSIDEETRQFVLGVLFGL